MKKSSRPLRVYASVAARDQAMAMTLIELLVIVAIMGILAGISVGVSMSVLNREKVNSLAFKMAGWIEEVRNISAKRIGASQTGCTIAFAANSNSVDAGDVLATVSPISNNDVESCSPKSDGVSAVDGQFIVPFDFGGTISFAAQQSGLSGSATITYNPRGTWQAGASATGDLVIKLLLNGSGPMRCLRISETLAFVDIGKSSTQSITTGCENEYSRF